MVLIMMRSSCMLHFPSIRFMSSNNPIQSTVEETKHKRSVEPPSNPQQTSSLVNHARLLTRAMPSNHSLHSRPTLDISQCQNTKPRSVDEPPLEGRNLSCWWRMNLDLQFRWRVQPAAAVLSQLRHLALDTAPGINAISLRDLSLVLAHVRCPLRLVEGVAD